MAESCPCLRALLSKYFPDNTVPGRSKSALKPRSRSQGHVPHADGTLTIDLQMSCEKAAGLLTGTQNILIGYCDKVPDLLSINGNRTLDNWGLLHCSPHPVQWNQMHGVAWPRGVSEFDARFMTDHISRSLVRCSRSFLKSAVLFSSATCTLSVVLTRIVPLIQRPGSGLGILIGAPSGRPL